MLPEILGRAGTLSASNAREGEPIRPGHIYVAPPDHHLLIGRNGTVRTTRGPKENRTRPAVDPLFRSAALACGPRVIGVVLTGFLDDGTAGLWAIKDRGGIAIVQHPADALAPSMPLNALRNVDVDHCVPLNEIPRLLTSLAGTPIDEQKGVQPVSEQMQTEVKIAREDRALETGISDLGEPSMYACPECHGVLLQLKEGSNLRFRCHTGHAYSIEALLADLTEKTEEALWNAVRSMQETALLLDNMARQLSGHEHAAAAGAMRSKAAATLSRAELVRQALATNGEMEKTAPEPPPV